MLTPEQQIYADADAEMDRLREEGYRSPYDKRAVETLEKLHARLPGMAEEVGV